MLLYAELKNLFMFYVMKKYFVLYVLYIIHVVRERNMTH